MASMQALVRGWAGLAAAFLLAPAAGALDITGLSVTRTALNTADLAPNNTGGSNNRTQIGSSTSIVITPSGPVADTLGANILFKTQYASTMTADRELTTGNFTQTQVSDYSITFTVDNPAGHTYRIDIDTLRVGALTIVTDGANTASLTLGNVTGSVDTVSEANFALAQIAFNNNATGL